MRILPRLQPTIRVIPRMVLYLVLLTLGLLVMLPFVWMVSTAFKEESARIFSVPVQWIPNPWRFDNFSEALNAAPLGRYFINSLIVASGVVIERLVFSTVAAYAFARLKFPGRDLLFTLFLATVMIPEQVNLIPLYLITRSLGWLNSYQGMIIPSLAHAFSIFWLRQYFQSIPSELEDAARIDGCSRLGVLFRIVLPLSGPALAVLVLLSFNEGWNMFLWPLIMTDSPTMRTIEVGMAFFRQQFGGESAAFKFTWVMAANTLAVLPMIIVFLLTQRYVIRGIALTGLKG